MAQQNIIDYLEISPECGVIEIITPSKWVDKSIMNSHLRRKYGITVIAVRRAETDEVMFSPPADTVLHKNDVLTVIGSKKDLDRISTV